VPTYAYACTACDHRFEIFQSFSDDSLTQCPECEGRLRKLFNAVGVVFKGNGFYRTHSRAGSSASVPAASGETSPAKPASTPAASSTASGGSAA